MNFLLIASAAPSLVNFRLDLIRAIIQKGFVVHAACPDMSSCPEEEKVLFELGVVIHKVNMDRSGINPLADFVTVYQVWRLVRKIRPAVVMAYTIKPVIYGMIGASISGSCKKFPLITGLGYSFSEGGGGIARSLLRRAVIFLYSLSLNRANKVFFQNSDDEKLFRSLNVISRKVPSVVVNGSGVNMDHFYPRPLPEQTTFVLVARLLAEKGVREYAAAASYLKSKYPDVKFMLVGYLDDNPSSITQGELNEWVSEGSVVYVGHLKDVRPAIAASSVFVLPTSYREGVPRTILEALSMGRAVITTNTPGCRETVVEGRNGYLVPVKSTAALIEAMEKLILDKELIESMGEESLNIARIKYDVHKVNDFMLGEMNI